MSDNAWKYGLAGACGVLLIAVVVLFMKVQSLESRGAKIGYVKSDQLMAQYKPAIAVQQRLQQESAGVQKELEGRYGELQMMNADLETKSKVLSSAAMAPHVEKFQRKQQEFYQIQQSVQQQVGQKQAQLLEPIIQDIGNFINKYGKDHGYTVIFGTPMEGVIVYGDAGNDLTEALATELNAKVPPSMPVPFNADTTRK